MELRTVDDEGRQLWRVQSVANFSRPRLDRGVTTGCVEFSRDEGDKRSLGSACSTSSVPGMIEDRDSEGSGDDEVVNPAHETDHWDTYWATSSSGALALPSNSSSTTDFQPQPAVSTSMWFPILRRWRTVPSSDSQSETASRASPQPGNLPRSDSGDSTESYNWPLPPVPAQFYKRQEALSQRRSRWRPKQAKARYTIFRQNEPVSTTPIAPVILTHSSSLSRPPTAGSSTASTPSEAPNSPPLALVSRPVMQPRSPPLPRTYLSPVASSASAQLPMESTRSAPPTPLPPSSTTPTLEEPEPPKEPPPRDPRRRPSLTGLHRPSTAKNTLRLDAPKTYPDQKELRHSKSQPYLPISPTEDLLPHYQDSPPLPPVSHASSREALRSNATSDLMLDSIPELRLQHPQPIRPRGANHGPSMSVFELDSDSESTYSDNESQTLAQRIVRGLTGHKRGASENKRTARGDEAAKAQLQRARAETTDATPVSRTGSSINVTAQVDAGSDGHVSTDSGSEYSTPRDSNSRSSENGPAEASSAESLSAAEKAAMLGTGTAAATARPRIKRQGSDMFGRIFGRRSQ